MLGTFVAHIGGIHWRDSLVGHKGVVRHIGVPHLWVTLVGHIGGAHLWSKLVGHKEWWATGVHLWDTLWYTQTKW